MNHYWKTVCPETNKPPSRRILNQFLSDTRNESKHSGRIRVRSFPQACFSSTAANRTDELPNSKISSRSTHRGKGSTLRRKSRRRLLRSLSGDHHIFAKSKGPAIVSNDRPEYGIIYDDSRIKGPLLSFYKKQSRIEATELTQSRTHNYTRRPRSKRPRTIPWLEVPSLIPVRRYQYTTEPKLSSKSIEVGRAWISTIASFDLPTTVRKLGLHIQKYVCCVKDAQFRFAKQLPIGIVKKLIALHLKGEFQPFNLVGGLHGALRRRDPLLYTLTHSGTNVYLGKS